MTGDDPINEELSVEANPYDPGVTTQESAEPSQPVPADSIGQSMAILIGTTHGATIGAAFGLLVVTLIFSDPNLFSVNGASIDLVVNRTPLYVAACGLLGGISCGILLGKHVTRSVFLVTAAAIVCTILFLWQDASGMDLVVFGGATAVASVLSTLACNNIINKVNAKRAEVVDALQNDPYSSLGRSRVFFCVGLVVLAYIVMAWLSAIGFWNWPKYGNLKGFATGYLAGASVINILLSLRMIGAFPNRERIGWATASLSLLVVVFGGLKFLSFRHVVLKAFSFLA